MLVPPAAFRITISWWRFTTRRAKHGVADEDILHAIDHALAFEDAGEDPDITTATEGNQLAIHAMPMRDNYRRLLGL